MESGEKEFSTNKHGEVRAEIFDPDRSVLGMAPQAATRRRAVRLGFDRSGQGERFAAAADMPASCRSGLARFAIGPVTADERDRPLATGLGRRNMDEFTWSIAYAVSDGRFMGGCRPSGVVRLRRGPNLAFATHNLGAIRMCALYSQSPTSLTVANPLLGISRSEVWRFYSAARAARLAEVVNRGYEMTSLPTISSTKRSLIERMLRRIAMV